MILFCTVCGQRAGWGHLMRDLAIADELSSYGEAAAFHLTGDIEQARRLLKNRYPITSSKDLSTKSIVAAAKNCGALKVLLDSYDFSDMDEEALSNHGLLVAVMDDFGHNPHRFARLIVNGNLYYSQLERYESAMQARLLLGPDYAPLRLALAARRVMPRRASPKVSSILVIMGGSDTTEMLDTVLKILADCTDAQQDVFVAAMKQPLLGSAWSGLDTRLHWLHEPDALALAMSTSDIAISAGGMTSYELAYMGVPTILLPVTEYQRPVSAELHRRGAALLIDSTHISSILPSAFFQIIESQAQRQAMITAAQAIFDGQGVKRIAAALAALAG